MSALALSTEPRLKIFVGPSLPFDPALLQGEFEQVGNRAAAAVVIDGPDARQTGQPLVSLGAGVGEGRLPLDATPEQVAAAIRAVAAGLIVRTARNDDGLSPWTDPPASELLTPRELEVLQALTRGASNKEIARQLGLSLHTVKFYVEAVFRKLDAHSRAEAVAKGFSRLNAGRTAL